MKYFYKALSANTRDMRTGLVVFIEGSSYLFNVPEGFQRHVLTSKDNLFSKQGPKYIFLSSLSPDHFGGFPTYYLSSKLALEQNSW